MASSRRMSFGRFDYATFGSFFCYAAGTVAVPVTLVLMAQDLGFPLAEGGRAAGGALSLIRVVPMVATMLLCGFLAGRFGKRRVFGWAVLLMGVGTSLAGLAPGYAVLLLALTAAGLGEGVIEGLATPFVRDLHVAEPGRYINFSHAFWSVGVLVTVLAAGALLSADVSWRAILFGVGLLTMAPAALLLLPSRRGHEYPEHPEPIHRRVVLAQAKDILRRPRFWRFFAAMFLAGGGELCLTFWSASHIQLNIHAAPWAGAVGTAFFAAGMVVGRTGSGYLLHQRHLRSLVLYSALAGVAVTAVLPWITSLWLFCAVLLLAGVATAPYWPSIQSHAVDCLDGADSTMVFILLSCAGVPGCGFFTWLMGFIGDRLGSLTDAFLLVPACYLLLAGLIAVGRDVPHRVKERAHAG